MSDTIHRSEEDADSKKILSDGCGLDCRFKDIGSGKCIFETCLLEELPPFQVKKCSVNCFICGKLISDLRPMSIVTDYRVCGDCKEKLVKWIKKCDRIISHVDSCPDH